MAIKAICVACGKPKKHWASICKACQYLPETEYQLARSLVFSLKSLNKDLQVGRSNEELKKLSKQVTGGRPYEFDPKEVELALSAYKFYVKKEVARKKKLKIVVVAILILLCGIVGLVTYFSFF